MSRKLTDHFIASVKATTKRQHIFDSACPGLCLRVTPSGEKTFTIVTRGPNGKQIWREVKNGNASVDGLARARELAREGIARIRNGLEAFPKRAPVVAPNTLQAVAENFIERHVRAKGRVLRSADEVERQFRKYVFPALGALPINNVRRGDIAALLDHVEDRHGATQADRVLAALRKCLNWHATRDGEFSSPIVKGMARTKPGERRRKRVLADDELRLIWPLLDVCGAYGGMAKVGLLTGQRLEKIATMRWADIGADGTWTIPTVAREKNNPGVLPLPRAVLDEIEAQPKIVGNSYVFAGRGKGHFRGYSNGKEAVDAKIFEAIQEAAKARGDDPTKVKPMSQWQFHDMRRSAKTLMQRAGVRPDISERVLGHVIAGVEGVYDRHSYALEKGAALESLAATLERILNPSAPNVVTLRPAQPEAAA